MGPSPLPTSVVVAELGISVAPYLLESALDGGESEFCLQAVVDGAVLARECMRLSDSERDGIALTFAVEGQERSVRLQPDGGISTKGL